MSDAVNGEGTLLAVAIRMAGSPTWLHCPMGILLRLGFAARLRKETTMFPGHVDEQFPGEGSLGLRPRITWV
jgi:hypothetical protein